MNISFLLPCQGSCRMHLSSFVQGRHPCRSRHTPGEYSTTKVRSTRYSRPWSKRKMVFTVCNIFAHHVCILLPTTFFSFLPWKEMKCSGLSSPIPSSSPGIHPCSISTSNTVHTLPLTHTTAACPSSSSKRRLCKKPSSLHATISLKGRLFNAWRSWMRVYPSGGSCRGDLDIWIVLVVQVMRLGGCGFDREIRRMWKSRQLATW